MWKLKKLISPKSMNVIVTILKIFDRISCFFENIQKRFV